jgi:predicted amidophosphoribosyltransferase
MAALSHDGFMTWKDVLASVCLGSECLGCGRPGLPWCRDCMRELTEAPIPAVVGGDPFTVSCCEYSGCIPEAIVGFKDRNVRALGPVLGDIAVLGIEFLDTEGVLVPAPSAPSAVRRRGFDHTAQLAEHAGERLGLPTRKMLRSRRRKDQAGLSQTARRRNLEESMWVPLRGEEAVIIIDDVRTTGATLTECERALSAAGFSVVGKVVVASTQR